MGGDRSVLCSHAFGQDLVTWPRPEGVGHVGSLAPGGPFACPHRAFCTGAWSVA